MNIIDFEKGDKTPIAVALGFFDSIHLGHEAIIERTKQLAKERGINSSVFTFKNDLSEVISSSKGLVLTYEERLKKLEKLSVNTVISQTFTKEFASITPREFFSSLINKFSVCAIVCGEDYTFGLKGQGNVQLLKELCLKNNVLLVVMGDVLVDGERVSTTKIKNLLYSGEVKIANSMLGQNYFISGKVCHGREVGRQMGFPTANVCIPSQKAKLKCGVYKTHVFIDGKTYNCITNYGGRPTFDLDEVLTETYIDGYLGDLYDKEITIYFDDYVRDLVKFDSVASLKEQLNKDLEKIR